MPTDPAGTPEPEHQPHSPQRLANSPTPEPSTINAQALYELFLANADRGDNTANDHLITEMVDRIRSKRKHRRPTPNIPMLYSVTCENCPYADRYVDMTTANNRAKSHARRLGHRTIVTNGQQNTVHDHRHDQTPPGAPRP